MTMIDKIKQQDGLIKSLQSRLSKLATESEQLRKERDELADTLERCRAWSKQAEDANHKFSDENYRLNGRLDELQAKLDKATKAGEIITAQLNDLQGAFARICEDHADYLGKYTKAKEALEFYANINGYEPVEVHIEGYGETWLDGDVVEDNGQRARTTLEEIG